jgi:hypothetical protein
MKIKSGRKSSRDMRVARDLPGPKTPRCKRHRIYAHDQVGRMSLVTSAATAECDLTRAGTQKDCFLLVFLSRISRVSPTERKKGAHLESTTIWRLESRQNPHAGKRALRSAAFPGCGLAELSSSASGARLRRTLVVVSRCDRKNDDAEKVVDIDPRDGRSTPSSRQNPNDQKQVFLFIH